MTAQAYIGQQNEDGTVTGIYLEKEGDPDWTGRVLAQSYADHASAAALMALGDLNSLERTPAECDAFGREWGRPKAQATRYEDWIEFYTDASREGMPFAYLLRQDGRWYQADAEFLDPREWRDPADNLTILRMSQPRVHFQQ